MIRDGNAAVTGTTVRDFYGGRDRCIRGTDDLLILPLQSGTQWDALGHIVFEDRIYNGYDATVSGARAPFERHRERARPRRRTGRPAGHPAQPRSSVARAR